jgi:hypothetical protein
MIGSNMLVTRFVTPRLMATTHCHDNFGYYFPKTMIPRTVIGNWIGTRYAVESKLVYS